MQILEHLSDAEVLKQAAKAIVLAAAQCRAGTITFGERDERVSKLVDILAAQAHAPAPDLKAQALALCHALEEQPGSQYQTAAVLAAFKVYRAFESIEKHGEIRQWVFDVAAPAVGAVTWTDAAILSLLRSNGDGPFGEEDIATTRRFMERAEAIRVELA